MESENPRKEARRVGPVERLISSLFGKSSRNVTLMIGLPADRKEAAMEALQKSCRQRVEYIPVSLESAPMPLTAPTPVTIGGATIFSVAVEHYEEF